ncbi:MAG: cell division protein FtsL [Gammaproteobacteria bacterium]|nr:cell division protein FtsL [Gammaproteobacteria bacterium]
MNAAARFNQGVLSRGWAVSAFLTRARLSTLVLFLAILTSALSMVYVTNATRSMNASYQQNLVERDHLHVQWGQLLLEKSTWMMQARVQTIAEKKLGMVIPDGKSVVIINSKEPL